MLPDADICIFPGFLFCDINLWSLTWHVSSLNLFICSTRRFGLLKGINPLLTGMFHFLQLTQMPLISYQSTKIRAPGDLLKALRDAGHGDEIVICDCNFPGKFFMHTSLGAQRQSSIYANPNHVCTCSIAVSSSTDTILGKASITYQANLSLMMRTSDWIYKSFLIVE